MMAIDLSATLHIAYCHDPTLVAHGDTASVAAVCCRDQPPGDSLTQNGECTTSEPTTLPRDASPQDLVPLVLATSYTTTSDQYLHKSSAARPLNGVAATCLAAGGGAAATYKSAQRTISGQLLWANMSTVVRHNSTDSWARRMATPAGLGSPQAHTHQNRPCTNSSPTHVGIRATAKIVTWAHLPLHALPATVETFGPCASGLG